MKLYSIFLMAMVAAVSSFASVKDFYFHKDGDRLCVGLKAYGVKTVDASGNSCKAAIANDVRIRVINAHENSSQKLGFDIERPFLILDGIYLSTDGRRTLSELYDETNKFGMSTLLSNLGYTPILVQFAETVERSLPDNAQLFTDLLQFMNNNKLFGFANRTQDGFIVLGISQGGILGRYGSYKYDIQRKSSDAPIRMYASLDSPHQGAVMPKGLLYTINFWATSGGAAAAEAFNDLIEGPGASGLLINQSRHEPSYFGTVKVDDEIRYKEDFSTDRFLFGEYRKAAEYKGFPSVLISQGLLRGESAEHPNMYFSLNRKAEAMNMLMGRVVSNFSAPGAQYGDLSYNRLYQKMEGNVYQNIGSSAKYDFVQGSTYPFAQTMYESLKEGFEDAMPKNMKATVLSLFGKNLELSIKTSWDENVLYQGSSTFIPATSAMDLKCDGKLSITEPCAFTQKFTNINFEDPGNRSSAKAIYAVDPNHPRYVERNSGRHIELPSGNQSTHDKLVIRGMQADVWRILCEAAKIDYDVTQMKFRNPHLAEHFDPDASCREWTNAPAIIRNAGFVQTKRFAYARYEYNKDATEKSGKVPFDLAAGWHRVALFDNGGYIPAGSAFEIDIQVDNPKGNWMKAELMLHQNKSLGGQLQLSEISVPVDGKRHTIRWPMPFSGGMENHYRWFRLVLNSDGGRVTLSDPRIVISGIEMEEPDAIKSGMIYPNGDYAVVPWNGSTAVSYVGNPMVSDMKLNFKSMGNGLHIQFGKMQSLKQYSKLKVVYAPGTCQNTAVYFDSYKRGQRSLAGGSAANGLMTKSFPLQEIVDTQVTPNFSLAASGLSILGQASSEICTIHQIFLEK